MKIKLVNNNWEILPTGSKEQGSFYIDGILKENLDLVKNKIKNDWDMVFIYSGPEGAGKSTKCFQDAYYCSGDRFTMNHVCFNPEDFEKKITTPNFLKAGDSLVLDEGFFVNARASMTELNRRFLGILAECRQKNLFLFIVCPNFFDLDKNLSLWRSRGLFYIYHDRMNRGYFKFYSYEKKKLLYIEGKKFYNYIKVKPDFYGRFSKEMPFPPEEYKRIKLKAFENRQRTKNTDRYLNQRNLLLNKLIDLGQSYQQIADYLTENGERITKQGVWGGVKNVNSQE